MHFHWMTRSCKAVFGGKAQVVQSKGPPVQTHVLLFGQAVLAELCTAQFVNVCDESSIGEEWLCHVR
jgi:hypothetical protein